MQRTITLQFLYKMMAMMMANWVDKNLGMHSWSIISVKSCDHQKLVRDAHWKLIRYDLLFWYQILLLLRYIYLFLYKIWISKKHLVDFLWIKDQFHNNMGPIISNTLDASTVIWKSNCHFFCKIDLKNALKRLFEFWIFIPGKHFFFLKKIRTQNISYLLKHCMIHGYDISIMLYVICDINLG